jgi:hypothetical protein
MDATTMFWKLGQVNSGKWLIVFGKPSCQVQLWIQVRLWL